MLELFFKGMLVGILIAAPVGPIALLCMRRTLNGGFRLGFATGMGAVFADAFYGAVAAFGIAAVGDFLIKHDQEFSFGGGIILFVLGWRMIVLHDPEENWSDKQPRSYFSAFISSFFLTITNPITVLAFAAMLTLVKVGTSLRDFNAACILLAGIFGGATLWWLSLSCGIKSIRHRVTASALHKINVYAGFGLIFFGLYALAKGANLL